MTGPLRILTTEIQPWRFLKERAEADLGFPLEFIETDFNNFRDNAPSYSRLGYFASKNFLPGVEFVDGNSKCRGSKREGFMTIEEIGESSVRVCF